MEDENDDEDEDDWESAGTKKEGPPIERDIAQKVGVPSKERGFDAIDVFLSSSSSFSSSSSMSSGVSK